MKPLKSYFLVVRPLRGGGGGTLVFGKIYIDKSLRIDKVKPQNNPPLVVGPLVEELFCGFHEKPFKNRN